MTAQGDKQRKNDTNSDSDGPTWIQTATGGDKPQTAGGTPTTKLFTTMKATAVSAANKGASNKHKDTRHE